MGMNTSRRSASGPRSLHHESFVLTLQFAAGLLLAQQIAGKAARDGFFLQCHAPRALPAMIAGSAVFSVALSLLIGRAMQNVTPRAFTPWALAASGVLQALECWLLVVSQEIASVLIYLH